MPKMFKVKSFDMLTANGSTITIDTYETRTYMYVTHHAVLQSNTDIHGKYRWQNRPWGDPLYNALKDFAWKYGKHTGNDADIKALLAQVDAMEKAECEEWDKWFNNFKKRYNALSDTTKKHLANACPHITSKEQAEDIMKISEGFDVLFRLEDGTL